MGGQEREMEAGTEGAHLHISAVIGFHVLKSLPLGSVSVQQALISRASTIGLSIADKPPMVPVVEFPHIPFDATVLHVMGFDFGGIFRARCKLNPRTHMRI